MNTRSVVYFKDAFGDEAPVTADKLCVTESLKELSQIAFSFLDRGYGRQVAQMCQPYTTVEVKELGQTFRIINVNPTVEGSVRRYTVNAVHIGTALHDNFVEGRLEKTQSLDACMKFITSGTKFDYVIHDDFKNYSFSDGFGTDYADALFMGTLSSNFGFEFWFDNYTIHIAKRIGLDDQFEFVDGMNLTQINWTEDYTNVQTKIKGLGKVDDKGNYAAKAEYTSPNAKIWGITQAATIQDDRFTDSNALLEYIKGKLQDYPVIQYSVQRAFYENSEFVQLANRATAAIGNGGHIKDRMGVDIDVRIIGRAYYPFDPDQSDTLTFGNYVFDFAHNLAAQQRVRQTSGRIKSDLGIVQGQLDTIINQGNWYDWK